MPSELRDRRVLVTGASSGIGRALAVELARGGARLLLAARREERLRELAEQCRSIGGAADFLAGDVADEAYREALVARAAQTGGMDVLVNNAGISAHGSFAASDQATMRRIMEVNFFAATELARLAIPLLAAGCSPAIVNIGSVLGHRGLPFNSEYCASKFALRGWSEAVRGELAARGIHVLLVSPGATATELFEHLIARRTALPGQGANGVSPHAVAKQTIGALRRRRREIFPNWRGRALVVANRLLPGLVDRAVAKLARGSHNEDSQA